MTTQDDGTPINVSMSPKVAHRQHQRLLARRSFLQGGLGAASLPILVAACGSSGPATATSASEGGIKRGTTVRIISYIDWFGKSEISEFEKKTGITVDQVVIDDGSARIAKLAADPTAADMSLADLSECGQFQELGILAKVDYAKNIPNYSLVPTHYKIDQYSESSAFGIVSDYGRTSFAYRTDKVSEDLRSWKDVWSVASKYSGKMTFLNAQEDCTSSALAYLGYNLNSTVPSQVNAAGDALIAIKPHLLTLTEANAMNGLLNGSVYIAMDWDYDAAAAISKNTSVPIKWVDASDGMYAYLEGWLAFNKSTVLPEVQAFMNNHISPSVYGGFVNTQGISNMIPAAKPYLESYITTSPVLNPSQSVVDLITFGINHGEGQKTWDTMWANFQAA